jgi:two-component system sensor histidine kinase KdpD
MIRRIFDCESVALFDAVSNSTASSGNTVLDLEQRTRDAFVQGRDEFDTRRRAWFCMLRAGSRPVGALALRGDGIDATVASALASLVAVAIDRVRSFENESRIEAARQSEQLRTAVLDALAHDFKTPLTAIRAASSGLLESHALDARHEELVSLIDSESARLDSIASRLLRLARLDAKDVRVESGCVRLEPLLSRIEVPRVRTEAVDPSLAINADEHLISMALAQLIDNALKYSWPGSEVTVAAARQGTEAVISVHNLGEGIEEADRERVFERFYRGGNVAGRIAGTGLGLSIVRKIALAHEGRAWVASEAGGATFFLALPALIATEAKGNSI